MFLIECLTHQIILVFHEYFLIDQERFLVEQLVQIEEFHYLSNFVYKGISYKKTWCDEISEDLLNKLN